MVQYFTFSEHSYPSFKQLIFFEIAVALTLILIYIFNHFKTRSIEVNGNRCNARNGSELSTFQTANLKVKVIDQEECLILLHDENDAIALNNFGRLEDAMRIKRFSQSRQLNE